MTCGMEGTGNSDAFAILNLRLRVLRRAFDSVGILSVGERCLVVQRRVMLVIVQPLSTRGPALSLLPRHCSSSALHDQKM